MVGIDNIIKYTLLIIIFLSIVIYLIQKYNIEYYKLNGRTPEEIDSWLKKRKWYNKFLNNIKRETKEEYENLSIEEIDKISKNKIDKIISGEFHKEIISQAFCWRNTEEGVVYWGKREYEFLKWYFGQYIDFHLFK